MQTVKLTKKTVPGSSRTHWCHSGTKHLPAVYFVKSYGYYAYRQEDDTMLSTRTLRTLKDVREFIAEYDEIHENTLRVEREEREAREKAAQERWDKVCEYTDDYQTPVEYVHQFKEGQRLNAKFASCNKNNLIGEYVYNCNQPQLDEQTYWVKDHWEHYHNWRIELCQVEKVVLLTDEKYDEFVEQLMNDDLCMEIGIGRGGSGSDADLPDDWDFVKASEEERDQWRAGAFRLVTVVYSPKRRPIVTDGSGHTYARYVGIDPTPIKPKHTLH